MSRKHRKFKGFFRPKLGDLQKKKKKKKKKVFAKIQSDFSPKFRKFKRLRGGSFRMGGAIFHFSQKIGLKSTKYMRFCILHKPMGGARAPPAPPLATLLLVHAHYSNCERKRSLKQFCIIILQKVALILLTKCFDATARKLHHGDGH